MKPSEQVIDFDEIRKNAKEQGISLTEIAILYADLDESEVRILEGMNLIAQKSGGTVIGRFSPDGEVIFPDKATGVHYLGA